MSRFEIYKVYLLCSGLSNEDEGQSDPLTLTNYQDPVLHFLAPRLIALRGEDRNEEAPTTRKE